MRISFEKIPSHSNTISNLEVGEIFFLDGEPYIYTKFFAEISMPPFPPKNENSEVPDGDMIKKNVEGAPSTENPDVPSVPSVPSTPLNPAFLRKTFLLGVNLKTGNCISLTEDTKVTTRSIKISWRQKSDLDYC